MLISKQPYNVLFKRFSLWKISKLQKRLGDTFKEGASVKFTMDKTSDFPTLIDIDPCLLDTCPTCYAFYELGDAQRVDCGRCTEVEPRDRVDIPLKLAVSKEKKYTFSPGLTLTFSDEEDTYSTCVWSKNPLFDDLKLLSVDSHYMVYGWIKEKKDRGLEGIKYLIDLDDIPDDIE